MHPAKKCMERAFISIISRKCYSTGASEGEDYIDDFALRQSVERQFQRISAIKTRLCKSYLRSPQCCSHFLFFSYFQTNSMRPYYSIRYASREGQKKFVVYIGAGRRLY